MMDVKTLKNIIIPKIKTHAGKPIIEADQMGEKPDGSFATFKVTAPYIKGVGQAEEVGQDNNGAYELKRSESYKLTISFTAYDKDMDVSLDLAQSIFDWFDFYGTDTLRENDIVVVEKTDIDNRDALIVDEYERRNGFDVILRVTRAITKEIEYIENVDGITN